MSEDIMPLTELVEHLEGVELDQLRRWSDTDRKNNFPAPVEKLGKVKFYSLSEVGRWVELWQMTSYYKNYRSKRGTRTHSRR